MLARPEARQPGAERQVRARMRAAPGPGSGRLEAVQKDAEPFLVVGAMAGG